MNERIKELYITAMGEDCGERWDTQEEFIERFAELIVKKCLNMIENEAAQYAEPVWAIELLNDIKDHFGVEL
jgi:hypothetical protein